MKIDWSALGQVAVVSRVFGVGLVVLFAVRMTALSRRAVASEKNNSAPIDTAVAGVCFTACVAAVVYGLYLLTPQFH
jgi:NADH:ubiquinone oxidoreductase subunit 6 (subunit J)